MSIIQGTSKAAGGGYEIDQSIRFNDDDSSHLYRDQSAGDKRKATFSWWMKLGAVLSFESIWTVRDNGTNPGDAFKLFLQSDTLKVQNMSGAANDWQVVTSQLFRDSSAWYHVVLSVDTDQATDTNRVKVYVNGTQASFSSASYPAVNADQDFGSAFRQWVGVNRTDGGGLNGYFDGYLAEINFIDGTALDAASFGETNDDGVWIPKAYDGSYGTNGFRITGATASDLGEDFSGNNNDFTSSGMTTADQMLDTPTLNYCTWNVLANYSGLGGLSGSPTFSDGSLKAVSGATYQAATGTLSIKEGLFYWEVTVSALTTYVAVGIANPGYLGTGNYRRYYDYTGNKASNGAAGTGYGATYTAGDVIGIALDMTTGDIEFFKNNSSQGVAFTDVTSALPDDGWTPFIVLRDATVALGCGQSAFTYTPPAGFLELNTANLPTPSIKDGSAYFDTSLWAGNSTDGRAITDYNFQPDWVWIKARNGAYSHSITDAVRGAGKYIQSNTTDPEVTGPGAFGSTLAFTSDGFTLDNGTYSNLYVNQTGTNYVGWAWKANGAGSSNTDGTITSTASANTTAGFSISTYTGTGSAATIGHGLGIAPKMVIVKKRVAGTDDAWVVWHASLPGANYYLNLNDTGAQDTSVNYWNNTLPTSSVFSVGASNGTNQNTKTFVAYCFAEIPYYSSIGSYTGNGSTDGPMIYTGFKPAFVIFKVSSNAPTGWVMLDNQRDTYNAVNHVLQPNESSAENSGADNWDILSNGFKVRTTWGAVNGNGYTVTYMAFAENPFGGNGAAPATAR